MSSGTAAQLRRQRRRDRKKNAEHNLSNSKDTTPELSPAAVLPVSNNRESPANPCDLQSHPATHLNSQTRASGVRSTGTSPANPLQEATRPAATPSSTSRPQSTASPGTEGSRDSSIIQTTQQVGSSTSPPIQSIPTGPRSQRRAQRQRGFGMKGFGPSFGSRARAAELNAATAAKARENEYGPQINDPSFTQRMQFSTPGPVGVPDNTGGRGWKPLNAESPQYNPNVIDNRFPLNQTINRPPSRALSFSANTTRPVHPLRTVTTVNSGHENDPFNPTGPRYGPGPGMPHVMGAYEVASGRGHHVPGPSGPGGLSFDKLRLLPSPVPDDESTSPRGMGPDDLSPSKQEGKEAERRRLENSIPQRQLFPADPFVSSSSDRPASQTQHPYHINPPPGPGNPGYSQSRSHPCSEYGNTPNRSGNPSPGSQANPTPNAPKAAHTAMYTTAPHPAMPGHNEPRNKTPGPSEGEALRRAARTRHNTQTTPIGTSVTSGLSTPTHQGMASSSGKPTVGSSARSQKGKERARSVQTGSPEAYRTPHTSGNPGFYLQPQASSNSTNPLLQSNQPDIVQQPPLLNANPIYPPGHQLAGQWPYNCNQDVFAHLGYHHRPVPWVVAPGGKEAPRQSTNKPPPGLPIPDPQQDNIMLPSQDPIGTLEKPPVAPVDTDREGEEQLRIRIGEISREERARRLQSGRSNIEARRAHDMTNTLGNALVNLQAYVVGDPRKQAANFAPFGPVPDYAVEKTQDGHRSFFDNDPRSNVWKFPPPRETSTPEVKGSEKEQEGEGSDNA